MLMARKGFTVSALHQIKRYFYGDTAELRELRKRRQGVSVDEESVTIMLSSLVGGQEYGCIYCPSFHANALKLMRSWRYGGWMN